MNFFNDRFLVDTWAIGCIFAEMFLRKPLFDGETRMELWTKITDILGNPDETFVKIIPKTMDSTISLIHMQHIKEAIPWEKIIPDEICEPKSESK